MAGLEGQSLLNGHAGSAITFPALPALCLERIDDIPDVSTTAIAGDSWLEGHGLRYSSCLQGVCAIVRPNANTIWACIRILTACSFLNCIGHRRGVVGLQHGR